MSFALKPAFAVFVKNKKYEHGGRLNVKIRSLFCGDNS
jgi:hypothetical protein